MTDINNLNLPFVIVYSVVSLFLLLGLAKTIFTPIRMDYATYGLGLLVMLGTSALIVAAGLFDLPEWLTISAAAAGFLAAVIEMALNLSKKYTQISSLVFISGLLHLITAVGLGLVMMILTIAGL